MNERQYQETGRGQVIYEQSLAIQNTQRRVQNKMENQNIATQKRNGGYTLNNTLNTHTNQRAN